MLAFARFPQNNTGLFFYTDYPQIGNYIGQHKVRLSSQDSNNVFDLLLVKDYPYMGIYTTKCPQSICNVEDRFDFLSNEKASRLNIDTTYNITLPEFE